MKHLSFEEQEALATLAPSRGWRVWPAIAKLAGWRLKQTWPFLFVTWLGMLATVVLICALPLFSSVATTADVRSVAADGANGPNLLVQVQSLSPTAAQIAQISQQLTRMLQQENLMAYLRGAPQLIAQTPPLTVHTPGRATPTALLLNGYDPTQAAGHVTLLQGRLPQATTAGSLEIAITQALASRLGVQAGSSIKASYPASFGSVVWTLRIVGIIAPRTTHDSFWLPATSPFGAQELATTAAAPVNVLAANTALQASIAPLQATSASGSGGPGISLASTHEDFSLYWSYPVDITKLDARGLPALSQSAADLNWPISSSLARIQGVTVALPFGSLYTTLVNYQQQHVILTIVLSFLLLLVLAILLFLLSMLATMLIERQATVVATLRSRGATRQHVFGAFAAQGVLLSLLALLCGPPLALLLVNLLVWVLLDPARQGALSVMSANPLQALLDVKWYALVAMLVASGVMLLAIRRAAQLDIVTLRRETSRTSQVPFWQRLYLDVLVWGLILAGSATYSFFWQELLATQHFDPVLYGIFEVFGFITPPLFLAAALMLFLRIFPWILRLVIRLVARRRAAPAVLAFAQIGRASRPAARVIVLLVMTIASSCFLLTLISTNQARSATAADFAVGADFSGFLPASATGQRFEALATQYTLLPGVQAATIGYRTKVSRESGDLSLTAVDADTYAQTAFWSSQDSSQPLSELTAQLVAHRSESEARNMVYALADAAFWQQLQLSPGSSFTLALNGVNIHFIALAEIDAIPGVYDTPINPSNGVGVLVDYASYASAYARASGTALVPNYVWLRAHNDAASLASVRQEFPDLQDRLQMTSDNQANAVHLDLIGVLALAVAAALLLTLVGVLLANWLYASQRRNSFAVLRALGMTPRQVAAVLLWEQGFVYVLAILLGIVLAALLTVFVAPAVSLLDLTGPSGQYNLFDVPPVQLAIPYAQLIWLLGGLAAICFVALLLMAYTVSRPSLGQILRLSED